MRSEIVFGLVELSIEIADKVVFDIAKRVVSKALLLLSARTELLSTDREKYDLCKEKLQSKLKLPDDSSSLVSPAVTVEPVDAVHSKIVSRGSAIASSFLQLLQWHLDH